ncbi:MAG: hypothetical protein D6679_05040 [Candidatus Hydrogenedentota bacterium]|nr:MAG: hypothetical protein D6679_05040 [Candidatus Hydrogenedentota bacterium]
MEADEEVMEGWWAGCPLRSARLCGKCIPRTGVSTLHRGADILVHGAGFFPAGEEELECGPRWYVPCGESSLKRFEALS